MIQKHNDIQRYYTTTRNDITLGIAFDSHSLRMTIAILCCESVKVLLLPHWFNAYDIIVPRILVLLTTERINMI